jgi:hypothetical protein
MCVGRNHISEAILRQECGMPDRKKSEVVTNDKNSVCVGK